MPEWNVHKFRRGHAVGRSSLSALTLLIVVSLAWQAHAGSTGLARFDCRDAAASFRVPAPQASTVSRVKFAKRERISGVLRGVDLRGAQRRASLQPGVAPESCAFAQPRALLELCTDLPPPVS